ncbi:Hypothetical protein CINCED_3A002599 [Cinara cedri]|uniref:Uncharacterized protein n=1 Tax=Cinara cedri TaxID=506608 RepID=A0A5E4NKK0_9HEMI|nr:Hypothetical protein CINCED_3A002599 [Cinara cedri]
MPSQHEPITIGSKARIVRQNSKPCEERSRCRRSRRAAVDREGERREKNRAYRLNQTLIPQKDSAKYLGMHLNSRLNWKHHVRQKKIQIKEKMRKLYWLVGPHFELTIENKRILYVAIIKPIWTYGIQLWGCTSKSNIDIIQRCQNIALRTITAAYRFERNDTIHRDMMLPTIAEEIQKFARKHERRLEDHINPMASETIRLSLSV